MNAEQFRAYVHAEHLVKKERSRQYELLAAGKFKYGPESSQLSQSEILTVLTEEVGEVARHVCDAISNPAGLNLEELRAEIVQVAAVAIGWVERMNREIAAKEPHERPQPAVIMYHDVYAGGDHSETAAAAEMADWQRDPELGA